MYWQNKWQLLYILGANYMLGMRNVLKAWLFISVCEIQIIMPISKEEKKYVTCLRSNNVW